MRNRQTVAGVIVSMLEAEGVDRAYGVSGESYLPLLDELGRSTIDGVTCRHEGGAGLMAVADSRLTGRLSVCTVSRGPGSANAALAMMTAAEDAVPFLLLVGQVPKAHLRRGAFQELDYSKFFAGTAKWSAEITDPNSVGDIMAQAISAACSGTPGPVVVALPEDVLDEIADITIPAPYTPRRVPPSPETMAEVVRLLSRAEKPLLIGGGELTYSDGRDRLRRTAEAWNIPVLGAFRRFDLLPTAHPLFAGELGFFTTDAQKAAYAESDLILAVGTRLGDLSTFGYTFPAPGQTLIHVNQDAAQLGRNFAPTVGAACDAGLFLDALATHARAGDGAWPARLRALYMARHAWTPRTAADGVVFGNVIAALALHAAKDALFAMDAGISPAMLYRHFPLQPDQRVLCLVTGSMGFGIPAATAAGLRFPDRQVICIIGDGGFLMGGNELAVAAERKLPLVVILANNNSYGAIRVNLERAFPGQRTATELVNPDFQLIGQAYGAKTLKIAREDQIAPVLAEAFAHKGLVFVEVTTSLSTALPQKE